MITPIGTRSPMMVKAHVSPGLGTKTKPQIEQRSSWDHPENSRPSPQCGQRLRSPRRSAVMINFERCRLVFGDMPGGSLVQPSADDETFFPENGPVGSPQLDSPVACPFRG